jgi:hypothetical protein
MFNSVGFILLAGVDDLVFLFKLSGMGVGVCCGVGVGADFRFAGDGVQRKCVPRGLDDNGGIPGNCGSSSSMLSCIRSCASSA